MGNAGELYEFYTGARMLGMGGAYVNTVNDETALLTNPAGLAKIRGRIITVVDPEIEIGSNDQSQFSGSGEYLDMFDTTAIMDNIKNTPGLPFHLKAQLFPSIVLPNFGVGVYARRRYDAEVDSTGTTYTLNYAQDISAVLGYSLKFFGGIVKLGFTGRYVDHSVINDSFPVASTTSVTVNNSGSEGTGMALDTGLILQAPIAWLPSIGATVHDVGNTTYHLSSGAFYQTGANQPPDTIQRVDAGFALFPLAGKYTRISFTGEVHDLTNWSTTVDKMRLVHGGIEFNFGDLVFVRAGLNQRYYTAGIEFASEHMQFQVATYGEDIGTDGSPIEDRRFVGKFSFRF